MTTSDNLLTVKEAARRCGRTEGAFRWHIHNGTAPPSAVIMGRRVFRESDLEAWIDQQFEVQNQEAA